MWHRPSLRILAIWCVGGLVLESIGLTPLSAAPPPPRAVSACDHPQDGGDAIDVHITIPSAAPVNDDPEKAWEYIVLRAGEFHGEFVEVGRYRASMDSPAELVATVGNCEVGKSYWFRVVTRTPNGENSAFVETSEAGAAVATREWFDARRGWFLVLMTIICGAVIGFVGAARYGVPLTIRKIAGLDAIEDAVGRATEMGQACLFVPGVQDINDIQTIAGLTILGRVAEKAAEYDCQLDVPTSRSLVMTAARETVAAAFYSAARPDAFNEDRIYYVTDEQFGYVAHLTGMMVREKPAACFYLGAFFAESLILAETGNAVGAIQIAGTAQPAQLPFFVAACDYTLIGEEFFAASAYLSRDPDQLGSLKGQDLGKVLVAAVVLIGVGLATLSGWAGYDRHSRVNQAQDYLMNRILGEG